MKVIFLCLGLIVLFGFIFFIIKKQREKTIQIDEVEIKPDIIIDSEVIPISVKKKRVYKKRVKKIKQE
jgi:hypothetical protein